MNPSQARTDVTDASHILADQGILDAFGHVSCRMPGRPDNFLISRSLAPALVREADIVELDFDGNPVDTQLPRLFLERFIHSEIYRLRPTVGAIVHSHAPAVLPFTVVPSAKMRPICHMCGFLKGAPQTFDVADHVGPSSDLLIRNPALGRSLAAHLGGAAVVLMRGHGYTVVGRTVEEATYRAIYAARNCEIQLAAQQLGDPIFLTDGEAEACDATVTEQIERAWSLWRREATRERNPERYRD